MLVYMVRHAKAERDSPTGRDEDRPLTPLGVEQARYLGDALAKAAPPLEHRPDRILTSPAERAARTAAIIADVVGVGAEPEPALALNANRTRIEKLLRRLAEADESVTLIGHNPVLEEVVLDLTEGQPGAPDRLRTGELVALEITLADEHLKARLLKRVRLPDDE